MKTAMWALLAALCVLTVVAAFLLIAPAQGGTLKSEAISAAFTAMAVVVALLVAIQSASRADDEREAAQSRFFLESAEEAWAEAARLVGSEQADRLSWVAAARLIGNAKSFARRISDDAHKRRLEATRLRYRLEVLLALNDRAASFFYGSEEWLPLDSAAVNSQAQIVSTSGVSYRDDSIPESALRMIWDAAQFPEGYEDPIEGGFDESELDRMYGSLSGLKEYIRHKRRYVVIFGELVDRATDFAPPSNRLG